MAIKHQLSLETPDTNNCKVLRIFDTSTYGEGLDKECGTLQITSPGFNLPVSIEVLPYYNIVLNACSLGLQKTGCGDSLQCIPDGIYVIRYSVAPNDKVYSEYNHLRVTQTLNKYYNELCKLEINGSEPDADVKEKFGQLQTIKNYIDAAKVKVEYCHQADEGMELLLYAQKKLNAYSETYGQYC